MQQGEGLTWAERSVVSSVELFAQSEVITLGSDVFALIRAVLEAIRDLRCALGRRRWPVSIFGFVCSGEQGCDGTG